MIGIMARAVGWLVLLTDLLVGWLRFVGLLG